MTKEDDEKITELKKQLIADLKKQHEDVDWSSLLPEKDEKRKSLAAQLKADAEKAHHEETKPQPGYTSEYFAYANKQELKDYEAGKKYTIQKLDTPAIETNTSTPSVGNWGPNISASYKKQTMSKSALTQNDKNLNKAAKNTNNNIAHSQIREMPQKPNQTLNSSNTKIINGSSNDLNNANFNYGTNKVTLKRYNKNEQQDIDKISSQKDQDYIKGSSVVQYLIRQHEKTHSDHWNYDGQGELLKTPTNAAKSDHLTETTAYTVEHLAAAQLYTTMKNQGLTTYTDNGKEKPIEAILEYYPNLKETVMEEGFDAKNPEHIHKITQIAAENWEDKRQNLYIAQHMKRAVAGNESFSSKSWSEQLELLQKEDETYEKVSARMLKDVDIGQNTTVDLSACRDLLDTMSNEDAKELTSALSQNSSNKFRFISKEEFIAVNNYLENRGLKTDKEKMKYMAEFMKSTTSRTSEHPDPGLAKIIATYNPTIVYADNIVQTTENEQHIAITPDNNKYIVTEHVEAQKSKEIELAKANENKKTETKTVSHQLLAALQKQND